MRNIWIFSLLFVLGCAQLPKPRATAVLPDQGPVELALKPQVGTGDLSKYRSRTVTKTYTGGEIVRKISESLDFSVQTKVTSVQPDLGRAVYQLATQEKEGYADLSDFAMPEPGESLDITLNTQGKVLKAGEMPPGSIYFVPPVSLPGESVKVGDTWPMTAEWISLKSGIPLRMEIVSIFKAMRDCGASGRCAEIEISGDVSIVGAPNNTVASREVVKKKVEDLKMRFRSELKGRLLFSLDKGLVLYSVVRSDENLSGDKDSVQIASCMLSYVHEPADWRIAGALDVCDPAAELPTF
jgi:hypothetical protein